MSIELPVATRHHCDMAEKLLRDVKPEKKNNILSYDAAWDCGHELKGYYISGLNKQDLVKGVTCIKRNVFVPKSYKFVALCISLVALFL